MTFVSADSTLLYHRYTLQVKQITLFNNNLKSRNLICVYSWTSSQNRIQKDMYVKAVYVLHKTLYTGCMYLHTKRRGCVHTTMVWITYTNGV